MEMNNSSLIHYTSSLMRRHLLLKMLAFPFLFLSTTFNVSASTPYQGLVASDTIAGIRYYTVAGGYYATEDVFDGPFYATVTGVVDGFYGAANIPSSVTYHSWCETYHEVSHMDGDFWVTGSLTAEVTTIVNGAFRDCIGLTSVSIPNSVYNIFREVFSGCTSLTSVSLPSNLNYLNGGMFSGCTSLTNITIPSSVTGIGWDVFSGCTSLTSITIPEKVEHIYYNAFINCESLKTVYWESRNCVAANVSENSGRYPPFYGCNSLSHIYIDSEVESISGKMFGGPELDTVTCYAVVPPDISATCFSENTYENAALCVPQESIDAYKNAEGWKKFFKCVAIGTIPGGDQLLGDVNNDGIVDVQDVVLLIEYVLNGHAEAFNADNADMNADGHIDVTDVVALIDKVLNGN
jgi:hypothetical protein